MRIFRHVSGTDYELEKNSNFQFALRHSMRVYPSDTLFTIIPKNGCSTIRYSIAIANGFISQTGDLDWIHQNNDTFAPDLETAQRSAFAFALLRCPYRRLLSAFYDKIVNVDVESWDLYRNTRRRIHPHDLNFARFLDLLESLPRWKLDPHWRPQSDFLLFETYDQVFAIENFDAMAKALKERIDLEIIDTRPMLQHERDAGGAETQEDPDAPHYPAIRLLNLKRQGVLLSDESFFPPNVVEKVERLYRDDIRLYRDAGFEHLSLIEQ